MNEATALILHKRIESFFDVEPVPDDQFAEMLKAMRADFPESAIGKLPRVSCKACQERRDGACERHGGRKVFCETCQQWISSSHIHLDYVGHAHLTDRLNEVDPSWDWLPAAFDDDGMPKLTGGGSLWIILRFGGRFFQGIGDAPNKKGGDALKEMIGDALRNVSMRRGAALSLWMKERDVPEEGTGDDKPARPAAAPAKASAKKATATKKAPAAAPAKKAAPAPAEGGEVDTTELATLLAELPDPEPARQFIKGRGVNPDTWKGITPAKARSIGSALRNMGKVQASPNKLSEPPADDAPPPPPPAAPATYGEANPRVELAERAETLPEAWASVLRAEICSQPGLSGLRGSVGEVIMQAPDGDEWDAYLEEWVNDAQAKLLEDPEAVPPGGEPFAE